MAKPFKVTDIPECVTEKLDHFAGLIRHATAADKRPGRDGFRNHFSADIGCDDDRAWRVMCELGLAVAGTMLNTMLNKSKSQYYHATEAGCKFAGLSKAATRRAMEDD